MCYNYFITEKHCWILTRMYKDRIKKLEDRIGLKLPNDLVDFLEAYEGKEINYGEWFNLENILLASKYDIENYQLVEEGALLNLDELKYIIVLLVDNDSYVVADLRPDGKGVFQIWSDEMELGCQSKNILEFKKEMKKYEKYGGYYFED
jgi:hypothetical protein